MDPGAIVAVAAWAVFIILIVLGLCRSAAVGDEMMARALERQREHDEFAWGVWIGMETDTPHERRHAA